MSTVEQGAWEGEGQNQSCRAQEEQGKEPSQLPDASALRAPCSLAQHWHVCKAQGQGRQKTKIHQNGMRWLRVEKGQEEGR